MYKICDTSWNAAADVKESRQEFADGNENCLCSSRLGRVESTADPLAVEALTDSVSSRFES